LILIAIRLYIVYIRIDIRIDIMEFTREMEAVRIGDRPVRDGVSKGEIDGCRPPPKRP
jgi:hypothetical protein